MVERTTTVCNGNQIEPTNHEFTPRAVHVRNLQASISAPFGVEISFLAKEGILSSTAAHGHGIQVLSKSKLNLTNKILVFR